MKDFEYNLFMIMIFSIVFFISECLYAHFFLNANLHLIVIYLKRKHFQMKLS